MNALKLQRIREFLHLHGVMTLEDFEFSLANTEADCPPIMLYLDEPDAVEAEFLCSPIEADCLA